MTAVIKVEASLSQSANNEHGTLLVIVLASGNDVPLLSSTTIARLFLNGDQVLAEVSRSRINEEALSGGGLDSNRRESTSGGIIALHGLSGGSGIELLTGLDAGVGGLDGSTGGGGSRSSRRVGSLGGVSSGRSGSGSRSSGDLASKGEELVGSRLGSVTVGDVEETVLDSEARVGLVGGDQGDRSRRAIKLEELRVGDLAL